MFIPPLSAATGESSSLCPELIQFPSHQEFDNVTANAELHLLNQFLLSGRHGPCQRSIRIKADEFFLDPYRHHHRSEEHTSELQSRFDLVCRLLLEKKKSLKLYIF